MESIATGYLFLILIVLIVISAFFSGSETSMMAINRYKLKSLSKTNKQAKTVYSLLDEVEKLISTILLGNNLVNILASAITTIIAIRLGGNAFVIVASLLLTLVILIFAETAPKIFSAKYPEKIALPASIVISKLVVLLKPIVYIINIISKYYLKLLGLSITKTDNSISTEELTMAINDAKYHVSSNYRDMLLNIIGLEKVDVEDIMIPKKELISIDINQEQELVQQLQYSQYNRILIFDGIEDNIIGILHIRDVVNLYAQNKFSIKNIKKIIRKPYFIPETTTLSKQLLAFQKNKQRLALVIDEYGRVVGMVALEDILEEIVGNFTSNYSENFAEISKQEDGSYLINPKISLREFNYNLNLNIVSDNTTTINGLLLEHLEDIPKRDTSLKIDNVLFEILQVDKEIIKLVRVKNIKQNNSQNNPI